MPRSCMIAVAVKKGVFSTGSVLVVLPHHLAGGSDGVGPTGASRAAQAAQVTHDAAVVKKGVGDIGSAGIIIGGSHYLAGGINGVSYGILSRWGGGCPGPAWLVPLYRERVLDDGKGGIEIGPSHHLPALLMP